MNLASLTRTRASRRGVVLVVILGMLGLLALIGVTFATFSNQAQINARNFMQAQIFPDASEVLDYALSQLIDDSNNPASVIRGHSVKRDMYGSDATTNGPLLTVNPDSSDGSNRFRFQGNSLQPTFVTSLPATAPPGLLGTIKCITNIPGNSSTFYGFDFTRWVIRFNGSLTNTPGYYVGRTVEVLYHDAADSSGYHALYVAPPNNFVGGAGVKKVPGPDPSVTGYIPTGYGGTTNWISTLIGNLGVQINTDFGLDGRYLHAFNGPGLGTYGNDDLGTLTGNLYQARPLTEYANFRYNGNI